MRYMLPNSMFDQSFALSIGPQRAGVSWIEVYLRDRGDVCMPEQVKEIFFFDRHYERGAEFYFKHFNVQPQHKICMELTTTAFDHGESPKRVFSMFGDRVKLFCPLRHPVERSYSLYLHLLRYGIVSGSLQDAVEHAPQILNSSRYAHHLEKWFEFFPPQQIHLLFQEELEANAEGFVRELCSVLDLDYIAARVDIDDRYNITDLPRYPNMKSLSHFVSKMGLGKMMSGRKIFDVKRQQISRHDHEWLSDRLVREIEALETLTGKQIDCWRGTLPT